jgi:hypothetical protein
VKQLYSYLNKINSAKKKKLIPFILHILIKMSTESNTLRYIGGAALAGVGLLSAIYNDRALFDPKRPDIKSQAGWPLLGSLPLLVQNKETMHDFLLAGFNTLDGMTL